VDLYVQCVQAPVPLNRY